MERANGQVSGSDTSWLPLPITATSVNRPHHTPLLLSHTHTHSDNLEEDSEEGTQPSMLNPQTYSLVHRF